MCCEWMKKINWQKVLLAGFVYLIIATIVRQIEAALTMSYYTKPAYFGVWSKVMMPTAGPPPPSFMILSLLFTFITGLSLAVVFDFVKGLLPKDYWSKICCFTSLVVWLMVLFFTLPVYLLLNVPLMLLIWWFASSVVIVFLGTVVFVKVIK